MQLNSSLQLDIGKGWSWLFMILQQSSALQGTSSPLTAHLQRDGYLIMKIPAAHWSIVSNYWKRHEGLAGACSSWFCE